MVNSRWDNKVNVTKINKKHFFYIKIHQIQCKFSYKVRLDTVPKSTSSDKHKPQSEMKW